MISQQETGAFAERYRNDLLDDTVPFWLKNGLDSVHGGVLSSLTRDGAVLDSDKSVWAQGRFAWLLGTLARTVEARSEWIDAAESCLTFLDSHAFDRDGRMFFLLTQDGRPLRKRRYAFSEAFASMGHAAFASVTGSDRNAAEAIRLFRAFTDHVAEPKSNQTTRPTKGIGPVMIGINVAQTLRENLDFEEATEQIDRWIAEIEADFFHPSRNCLLEVVTVDGAVVDHFDGRTLNPGHAIEAAWFILHEARLRGRDAHLIELGTRILDCMWERGWDQTHGGLLYFTDLEGGSVQEYWHDMKFWWPHNEAVIATLLAYHLTGEVRFAKRHRLVHDWAHENFADPEFGEWFGYLHRDGSPSVKLKGNHWKGPFHVPRMQLYCWKLAEEMLGAM